MIETKSFLPIISRMRIKEAKYWRDVGTIAPGILQEASMDIASVDPMFNLYDENGW